jgi:hypothetical protein|nr:hypothetical protein [Kofleriaceae bacterium]
MRSDDDELLSAYVDGVAELTPAERERVRTGADPASLASTRDVLDQLRALPPEGDEPDWAAMERAIGAAVGDRVPAKRWWRGAVLWLVPAAAVAAAGIAIAVIGHGGDAPEARDHVAIVPPVAPTTAPQPPEAAEPHHSFVYVDGQPIDLDGATEEQILDGLAKAKLTADDGDDDDKAKDAKGKDDDDDDAAPGDDNLIGTANLAWVDHLDTGGLDKLEQVLVDHAAPKRKGT